MTEVFTFDEVEYSEYMENLRVTVSNQLEDLVDQEQDGEDQLSELRGSEPISIIRTRSQSGRHRIETKLQVEEDGSSSSVILGQSLRLGKSFEVGIDKNYVSSFATDAGETRTPRKMKPSDFVALKVLGEGAYGKVFLVKEKTTGRLFAQKQLKKASMIVEEKKIQQSKTERSILESVRHPYIVRLFYALQDSQKLYLILEYAQGGELFTHLAMERMFSEDVASFYVAEILLALHHLHVNVGVIYRDLKPENCLLDAEGHLVLTDFGLSKVTAEEQCRTFLGTPEYMAPEVLAGKEYDYSVDWWSLGIIIFELLTGNTPYRSNNHQQLLEKITKTKLRLPYYLSADAKDLLLRLLKKEPKKRLVGHKDIDIFKKHRFFRKIDWKKLEQRHPDIIPPIVPVITDPELAENFASSFTNMELTADDIRTTDEIAIPEKGTANHDHEFKGFSFTASQSFIDYAVSPR